MQLTLSLKKKLAFAAGAILLLPLWPLGCVLVRVYETADVRQEFAKSLQAAGDQLAAAKIESQSQSEVFLALSQRQPKGWEEKAAEAKTQVDKLKNGTERLKASLSQMSEFNGQFGALSHSRPRIQSRDAEWASADQLVVDFKKAAQSFNREQRDFAQVSQKLSQFWLSSGFYQKVSLLDIDERLEVAPGNWRGEHAQMVGRFTKAKNSFERWQTDASEEKADLLQSMATHLQDMGRHTDKLKTLIEEADALKTGFRQVFGNKGTLSNLDASWPRFEQFKARHNSLNEQHEIEVSGFKRAEEGFEKAARGLRAL